MGFAACAGTSSPAGWGCRFTGVADIRAAVETLDNHDAIPDAIIADYHLDDGTGIEAINALREAMGIEIPAVLVTADHSQEVRDLAAAQEVKLLNKPVRPAALRALLSQWRIMQRAAE